MHCPKIREPSVSDEPFFYQVFWTNLQISKTLKYHELESFQVFQGFFFSPIIFTLSITVTRILDFFPPLHLSPLWNKVLLFAVLKQGPVLYPSAIWSNFSFQLLTILLDKLALSPNLFANTMLRRFLKLSSHPLESLHVFNFNCSANSQAFLKHWTCYRELSCNNIFELIPSKFIDFFIDTPMNSLFSCWWLIFFILFFRSNFSF